MRIYTLFGYTIMFHLLGSVNQAKESIDYYYQELPPYDDQETISFNFRKKTYSSYEVDSINGGEISDCSTEKFYCYKIGDRFTISVSRNINMITDQSTWLLGGDEFSITNTFITNDNTKNFSVAHSRSGTVLSSYIINSKLEVVMIQKVFTHKIPCNADNLKGIGVPEEQDLYDYICARHKVITLYSHQIFLPTGRPAVLN